MDHRGRPPLYFPFRSAYDSTNHFRDEGGGRAMSELVEKLRHAAMELDGPPQPCGTAFICGSTGS